MASMNIDCIGLVPSETAQIVGLSNIRGSVGGLGLAIHRFDTNRNILQKTGYIDGCSNFGWGGFLWSFFK